MNTAIPLAVLESTIEPASEIATITHTAAPSSSAGAMSWSGHQSMNAWVITAAARKTRIT